MKTQTSNQILYQKIIETLRLVAAPSNIQELSFSNKLPVPNEIAFTVEEMFEYARTLRDVGFLSGNHYNLLLNIDNDFSNFDASSWTMESLKHDKCWKALRKKAMDTLAEFDEVYSEPNLFWDHGVVE